MIEITRSDSRIVHVPYEQAYGRSFDDMPRRVPKLDKVRRVIGFEPKHDLVSIIKSVEADQRAADAR